MTTTSNKSKLPEPFPCTGCGKRPGRFFATGYAEGDLLLCSACTLQLLNTFLEELCSAFARAGRHG